MESMLGPAIAVLVAMIAASGAWLTVSLARQGARQKREDALSKRALRAINYAQRLRSTLEKNDIEYEEWPEDLYDE